MIKRLEINRAKQKGVALVTTLLLTMLLSILIGAMLMASTADVLITGNDVRSNQAFYVAEAGINRAAGWFTSRFGTDPNTGLYVLPEQFPSSTDGQEGKLSYTNVPENDYKPGASGSSHEQTLPTSVKVPAGGSLQNVVLAGDAGNTFPTSYTVSANDTSGNPANFNYSGVVNDFTDNLHNQQVGDGEFQVKATLVSIIPPLDGNQGTITWLIESTGRLLRGDDSPMASATLYAYLSARVTPILRTDTVETGTTSVGAAPGVISRGAVEWTSNAMMIDSYRSSLGAWNVNLAANSFPGQIGGKNRGSRGDIRTNNENDGYINIKNGTMTGNPYSTYGKESEDYDYDPITAVSVSDGQGGTIGEDDKQYEQNPLIFPEVPEPTAPPAGAPNYTHNSFASTTLSGNYNNITVKKGVLTLAPGNYGAMSVESIGTLELGMPGQHSVYNFQSFETGAASKLVFRGPVTINVKTGLDVGGTSGVADLSLPASAIRWNFKGANDTDLLYIRGTGNTLGVFYAPNNDLMIVGTGDIFGAVAARNVYITGNAKIHVDEDAISGVEMTVSSTDTATITVGYTATSYSLWRITQAIR